MIGFSKAICGMRSPFIFAIGLFLLITPGCTLYAPPEGPSVASIGPDEQIVAADNAYLFIILPCSRLLAYTILQPHIPCDKLEVIDVFFESE